MSKGYVGSVGAFGSVGSELITSKINRFVSGESAHQELRKGHEVT